MRPSLRSIPCRLWRSASQDFIHISQHRRVDAIPHEGTRESARSAAGDRAKPPAASCPNGTCADLYHGAEGPGPGGRPRPGGGRRPRPSARVRGQAGRDRRRRPSAGAIRPTRRIQEALGRICSYAQLLFAGNMSDAGDRPLLPDDAGAGDDDLARDLLFFTLELNRLEERCSRRKVADAGAGALAALAARPARVPPAPARRRAGEAAAREVGRRPLRLDPAVRRDHGRPALPARRRGADRSEALNRCPTATARCGATAAQGVRPGAWRAMPAVRADHQHAGQGQGDRRHAGGTTARRCPRATVANMVEDEVVDALVTAVTAPIPHLSHRYYALKARWLGAATSCEYWDRNAPLPEDDDRADRLARGGRARARCLCAPSRPSSRDVGGSSSRSRGSTRR